MEKVIYEKQYPKISLNDLEEMLEADNDFPEEEEEHLTHEEIKRRLYAGVVYVSLPDRQNNVTTFVKLAIKLSVLYEMDIRIVEHMPTVSVTYYFDRGACFGFLKEIIAMSDDIAFLTNIKEHEIAMTLDYYTHAVYRHGKQFRP